MAMRSRCQKIPEASTSHNYRYPKGGLDFLSYKTLTNFSLDNNAPYNVKMNFEVKNKMSSEKTNFKVRNKMSSEDILFFEV